MGYHAADDPRLPETFICFDCKVKADPSWELIKVDLYPMMISKYKELAPFRCTFFCQNLIMALTTEPRRAIKVVENEGPSDFAQKMGAS
jgi:hypothetical protein